MIFLFLSRIHFDYKLSILRIPLQIIIYYKKCWNFYSCVKPIFFILYVYIISFHFYEFVITIIEITYFKSLRYLQLHFLRHFHVQFKWEQTKSLQYFNNRLHIWVLHQSSYIWVPQFICSLSIFNLKWTLMKSKIFCTFAFNNLKTFESFNQIF